MGYRTNIPEGEYLAGLDQAERNLQKAVEEMAAGGAEGLADAALYVLGEAVPRAPVDTGDLRGSGYVELERHAYAQGDGQAGTVSVVGKVPEDAIHAEVGFSSQYAANQHEQVNYTHPHGGQSKYLESVLVEEQSRILQTIAGKTWENVRGAGNA